MEILDVKNTTEIKCSIDHFNSRLDTTKERINELKSRSVEKSILGDI